VCPISQTSQSIPDTSRFPLHCPALPQLPWTGLLQSRQRYCLGHPNNRLRKLMNHRRIRLGSHQTLLRSELTSSVNDYATSKRFWELNGSSGKMRAAGTGRAETLISPSRIRHLHVRVARLDRCAPNRLRVSIRARAHPHSDEAHWLVGCLLLHHRREYERRCRGKIAESHIGKVCTL
jgi:hypothetical protein